jgi:Putative porin
MNPVHPLSHLTLALLTTLALNVSLCGQGLSPSSSATTAHKATTRTRKTSKSSTITVDEARELREALAAQHQQIQQLQQRLEQNEAAFAQAQEQAQQQVHQAQTAATDAQAKVAVLQSATSEQKTSIDQVSSSLGDIKMNLTNTAVSTQEEQRRISALEGLLGRFRFNGDIRVRGESFFQDYSGCKACFDRNRARVRVRFGFDGKLNEDFIAGVALATGSLGDPTTTNESFTNFFDRKTIGLDRGYVTYNPIAHKWLSLTGGKFAYPWQRTQVTGDPDINPEGFDEKLSFDMNRGPLKNFTAQSMQVFLNENTSSSLLRAHDAFMVGGQLSSKLDFGFLTTTPSIGVMNWRNVDELLNATAFAVQATTTGTSSTAPVVVTGLPVPGEGPGCSALSGLPSTSPCAFAPNGMTNATFLGPDGKAHFASQFLYGDIIVNNQVKTGIARLPFNLLLEAEQNLRAAGHPLGSNGKVRTDLGRQSHTYLIDASFGQTKNKNDFQIGYAFLRQEQDAVLASFAESDQRAPTNIVQHRVYGLWKLRPNTVASYTLWMGRSLNPSLQHATLAPGWTTALGSNEPILKRMQFDLIYSF